jgi:ActR/RegA family two-component response regulator
MSRRAAPAYRILLVDSDAERAPAMERVLVGAAYRVAIARSFEDALAQIPLHCPDVLITALRLGTFNGLHLVVRWHAEYPDLPAIVLAGVEDEAIAADAAVHRARFFTFPVGADELLKAVAQAIAGRAPRESLSTRRWPRKASQFSAKVAQASARVIDVSYGGLRLQFSGSTRPMGIPMQIELTTLNLRVSAIPRWTKAIDAGGSWRGVEVTLGDEDSIKQWRDVVDSVP